MCVDYRQLNSRNHQRCRRFTFTSVHINAKADVQEDNEPEQEPRRSRRTKTKGIQQNSYWKFPKIHSLTGQGKEKMADGLLSVVIPTIKA